VRGGLLALAAAVLFGISTPIVQWLGAGMGPLTTAALLYTGAAAVGALLRSSPQREARLQPSNLGRLMLVALFGAVLGPVALACGLQRTSGTSASLTLTLEAVFDFACVSDSVPRSRGARPTGTCYPSTTGRAGRTRWISSARI
jgi:drug/metabolite transporter (DMT)-like permease